MINEGFKNSPIYLGGSPIKANDIINMNNIPFASTSVYEIGRIDYPRSNKGYYDNYYNGYYTGYYDNYYSGYI